MLHWVYVNVLDKRKVSPCPVGGCAWSE